MYCVTYSREIFLLHSCFLYNMVFNIRLFTSVQWYVIFKLVLLIFQYHRREVGGQNKGFLIVWYTLLIQVFRFSLWTSVLRPYRCGIIFYFHINNLTFWTNDQYLILNYRRKLKKGFFNLKHVAYTSVFSLVYWRQYSVYK